MGLCGACDVFAELQQYLQRAAVRRVLCWGWGLLDSGQSSV